MWAWWKKTERAGSGGSTLGFSQNSDTYSQMVPAPVQLHVYANTYDMYEGTCIRLALQHTDLHTGAKKVLLIDSERGEPSSELKQWIWVIDRAEGQSDRKAVI